MCFTFFDPQYQYVQSHEPSAHSIPNVLQIKENVAAFKKTLELTDEKSREIERNTRDQRKSPLWFSVSRYRITASLFGSVLSRKSDTPPDSLVLRTIQSKSFSTLATAYGIEKEECARKEYISHQHNHGHQDLIVTSSGVIINPTYCFFRSVTRWSSV